MPRPAQAQQTPGLGGGAGPIHYSWVIVGILVVVQVIGSAISQSAGVMVAPLRDPRGDFGWGIGTIGALMAVYYLVGGLFAPVSGWLGARYRARRLMLAGGLFYGESMFLLGLVRQPRHFLLAFSLLLALTQSICLVLLMASVSDWFRRRLGLGTGILWAAGGLGSALLALWSAKKLSCRRLFKSLFMVQTTQNRTCHHSPMLRNTVPVSMPRDRQPWRWLRDAWTQGHMRTPPVIVWHPLVGGDAAGGAR